MNCPRRCGDCVINKECRPVKVMVGAGRFELPTPCSRSKCATRLRYAPPDRPPEGTALRRSLTARRARRGGFIAAGNRGGKRTRGSLRKRRKLAGTWTTQASARSGFDLVLNANGTKVASG